MPLVTVCRSQAHCASNQSSQGAQQGPTVFSNNLVSPPTAAAVVATARKRNRDDTTVVVIPSPGQETIPPRVRATLSEGTMRPTGGHNCMSQSHSLSQWQSPCHSVSLRTRQTRVPARNKPRWSTICGHLVTPTRSQLASPGCPHSLIKTYGQPLYLRGD